MSNYTFIPITNTKVNNKLLNKNNNHNKSEAYKNVNEAVYDIENCKVVKDDVQIINNYVNNNYNINILNEGKEHCKPGLIVAKNFSPHKEKNNYSKSNNLTES